MELSKRISNLEAFSEKTTDIILKISEKNLKLTELWIKQNDAIAEMKAEIEELKNKKCGCDDKTFLH